jgi:ABC-2 type transport system permease protein
MTSTAATRASSSSRAPWFQPVSALVRRDWQVRRSYRAAFVMDFVVAVMDLVVYYFIAKTFTGATTASLQSAPTYFAFALVGIAVTLVINSTTIGLALRVREEQLTGTLEALVAQPISAIQLAIGMCGFPMLFATARVVVYLLVGGVFLGVDFSHASWLGFVVMIAAMGFALSSIGVMSGAVVMVIKRGETFTGLVIFTLGLIGGAFFPISVLPDWLEPIGKLVPTRFAFDGLREALYKGVGWENDALILFAFGLVLFPASTWLFAKALNWARSRGSLSQY